jgi:predicted O-methyltransferase YrrM
MNIGYRLRELAAKAGVVALKSSGFFDGYWAHWRGPFFDYAEAKGLHILPVHYYSPIPHVGSAANRPRNGLPIDLPANKAKIEHLLKKYDRELSSLFDGGGFDPTNSAFGPLDAASLYCTIRETRPQRIVEIGSGHSTLVTAAAIRASQADGQAYRPHVTCIEPFLPAYLRDAPAEVSEILETPLQDVPLERFTSLAKGDILFIDSTHVANFGSDVLYEYLTILPALASGVLVHIHDIFLPYDYPVKWLKEDRFFWNEQYLLEAFLAMNPEYSVELAVHAASRSLDPSPAIAAHPSDVFPGSFWIRRV